MPPEPIARQDSNPTQGARFLEKMGCPGIIFSNQIETADEAPIF